MYEIIYTLSESEYTKSMLLKMDGTKLNFFKLLPKIVRVSQKSKQEKNKLFDYIIRNASIPKYSGTFRADVGIRSRALKDKDIFEIDDIGNLSQNFAYSEIDMQGKEIITVNIGDDAEFLIQSYFRV